MDKFKDHAMKIVRSAFAKQILAVAGIDNPALEEAFSLVPREDYLGAPPWTIARYNGHLNVASKNPAILYQDQLFTLQADRKVNNGSPRLHACGRRTAVEFNADLASKAKNNLSHLPNVTVFQGTGDAWPIEPVEAIYVNYACHRSAKAWLDSLKLGGKLIFPLGFPENHASLDYPATAAGIFLLIERVAGGYRARSGGPVCFVWGEGEPITLSAAPRESLSRGDAVEIKSLRVGRKTGREWFSDTDWGLSLRRCGIA